MQHKVTANMMIIALTLLVALLLALISLSLGAVRLPLDETLRVLFGQGAEENRMILIELRLPRILAALLVGAGLGAAGALLQGVIRNPLASPDILGVSGGASVFVVGFLRFFPAASIHLVPVFAVLGALSAVLLNYVLAWRRGVSAIRLILIGIGLSTAASALTTFMIISGPAFLAHQLLNWTTGSLYGSDWSDIAMLWPWIALMLPLSLLTAAELNVQALGDDSALGLGSRLQRSRLLALGLMVALAGAAVAVAGTISFLGLMAPHMARFMVGRNYRYVILQAALLGACLLLLADLAGRLLFAPSDIPAGVFTAGIGAPFFVYLLLRSRRRMNGAG